MKNIVTYLKNRTGSTLILTLITFTILAILGMTILAVSSSHLKITTAERDYQAVYYIAEAGITQSLSEIQKIMHEKHQEASSKDDFFTKLEDTDPFKQMLNGNGRQLDSFQSAYGKQPSTTVKISETAAEGNSKTYSIESVGDIGGRKRSVVSEFTVEWIPSEGGFFEEMFVYGSKLKFEGNQIYGEDSSIVIQGDVVTNDFNGGAFSKVTNIYIGGNVYLNGGSAGLGSASRPGEIHINGDAYLGSGTRHIHGDVYVFGDLFLKDAIIHGNMYINGDVTVGWTPTIHGEIKYTGSISFPVGMGSSIKNKFIEVDQVPLPKIPEYDIELQSDTWYTETQGYTESPIIDNGVKIFSKGNYVSNTWAGNKGTYEDVVIVSTGDITIDGGNYRKFVGKCALIAPYGKVTFSGAHFDGIVISKEGFFVTSGGSQINFIKINEIFVENEIPIKVSEQGSDGSSGGSGEGGDGTASSVKMEMKKAVREK